MATRQKGVVVPISATDNTARAFDSVNEKIKALQSEVIRLRSSGSGPGDALAAGMGHAGPQIAAASGLIREFEGNLPIRAVERFLTTTLGLGPALSAAFPLVGAVAFAGIIVENIAKVREFAQEGHKATQTIKADFEQVTDPVRKAGVELDIANDKLGNAIAKLEHKPENLLRLALDEDRKEIIDIATEATNASHKVDELLKKDAIGFGRQVGLALVGQNVSQTTSSDKVVRDAYKGVEKDARTAETAEDNATPETAAGVRDTNRIKLTNTYAEAIRKVHTELERVYALQRADTDHTDFSARTEGLEDALSDLKHRQHNLGAGFQHTDLDSQHDKEEEQHQRDKLAEEAERKAEEARRRAAEAQEKAAAAQRTLDDANAKAKAAAQRAETDTELAELESRHRALLVSDEDYYRQREAIQSQAIQHQRDAIASQRSGLELQVSGAERSGIGLTGNDVVSNNARITELRAKIVDLDVKDAALTGEAAKNTRIRADAETDLARRRIADADSLAAQLENERGGSVTARQQQNTDQYKQRRREAEGEFGIDSPVLTDLDDQHALDQDSIGAKGADQTFNSADADIRSRRTQVGDAQSRGQISNNTAQQQRIALDREEADALQPVLEAYEQLAKDGDLAAVDKVTDLKRRIAELKDPINDAAAEVRNQLDASFEALFENIDKGKRGLADFGKALEKAVTRDAFKQFVEPGLQAGLGLLIPNGPRGGSGIPTGSSAATAALSGLIPKAAPTLAGVAGSIFGVSKGKGGVTVEIINQTSQPVQSASATQSSLDNELESKVISIVLENTNTGGVLSSLFHSL